MDYENFKEQIAEEVKAGLYEKGFEMDVTTRHVDKLNEGYDAMTVTPVDSNIGMNINVSQLYEQIKDRTDYAKDDEKTEEGRYISSYACNPKIADKEFLAAREEYLRSHRKPSGEIIAYQIRQSFKPGEVSPEEANEIGYELAKSFTKGNHAFIVATHTDRKHIHNHIIFNSVTLDCDRKFKNFFLSSFVIQRISDGLCLQHGLSVIKQRPYKERDNKGYHRESLRSQVQADIDKSPEYKSREL